MMKKIILMTIIISGLVMLYAEPVDIKSDYGWKMLTIPLAPSIAAMAGTGAQISDEGSAFIEHPTAGLIGDVRSLSITQNMWVFDTQKNSIAINTATGHRSFGFALRALDYGKIEARDITGEIIGEFHPLDLNLIANYAQRVSPNYYAGINMMLLYQKIQTKSSTGLAVDLGLSYLPPLRGLTLNAAVKHLGQTTKVRQSKIKLPTTPELGINYHIPADFADIHTEVKILKYPDDDKFQMRFGTNFNINRMLDIRGGYHLNHDTQSFTAGLGLNLRRIDFNYAYLPFSNNISDAHSFGLTYKF